jgi:hypothetical protein
MAKFFLLFLSIIFFSFSAFSKDYTIEELINIAEQNSTNIRRAQYLALAQKRLANQQKYWSNPVISVGRLGDQDIYDVTLIGVPEEERTQYDGLFMELLQVLLLLY